MPKIKKSLNASLVFHIFKINETLQKNGDILTKDYGITTQQWLILLYLANDPNIIYLQENPQEKPLLAKELADAMHVSRANITNLINVLLAKGLIAQSFDKNDQRRKRLLLTKAGEEIIEKLEVIRQVGNDKLLADFSKEEKLKFIDFIQKCLEVLKRDFE